MDELWAEGWLDVQIIDRWINGLWGNGWLDGKMDECMDRWMYGGVDGWLDVQMMDGWVG